VTALAVALQPAPTTMDLRDASTLHQLALQAEGRSLGTQQLYLVYQRKFLEYLDSRRIPATLDALNLATVRASLEWFRGQAGPGARGGQVAARMFVDVLKIWASFLEVEGVLGESPLRKLKRVRVAQVLRRPFAETELTALWGACQASRTRARDEALFLLLLGTGMRIGEAMTLTLDKLDLDQRRVIVGLDGKGRRERLIPLGDPDKRGGGRTVLALRTYLRELRERPGPSHGGNRVFLSRDGYALTPDAGTDIIKRLGAAAGVDNCIPHRLRHSFATHYLSIHVGDELGLREIIGHVSREVLSQYVHLSRATVAERAGRASLAETIGTPTKARLRTGQGAQRQEDMDPVPAPVQVALPPPREERRPRRGGTPIGTAWGIVPKLPSAPSAAPNPDTVQALAELVRAEPAQLGKIRDPALLRAVMAHL